MESTETTVAPSTAKRTAILDQAIHAFAELGFRGADVQVIADRAGVGKGTVYRYFGSKKDLFWATTLEVFIRLKAELLAATKDRDGAVEILRATGRAYAGFFDANPECLEVFVQDRAEFRGEQPDSHRQYHEETLGHFVTIVEQGINNGELRPTDARKVVLSLSGLLYGTVVHSRYDCYLAGTSTLTEITEHALDIFLDGLRADGPSSEKGMTR